MRSNVSYSLNDPRLPRFCTIDFERAANAVTAAAHREVFAQWDAVLPNGDRLRISVAKETAGWRGSDLCGHTSYSTVSAVHVALCIAAQIAGDGQDVRELVPTGQPSRAELTVMLRGGRS